MTLILPRKVHFSVAGYRKRDCTRGEATYWEVLTSLRTYSQRLEGLEYRAVLNRKQIVEMNFGVDTPEPTWERSQSPLQRTESYKLTLEESTSKRPIESGKPHGIFKNDQTYEMTAEPLPDGDADKKG